MPASRYIRSLSSLGEPSRRRCSTRRAAAMGLGRFVSDPTPEELEALVRALRDRDEGVRYAAAFAFQLLGPSARSVHSAILKAASNEKSEDVQTALEAASVSL